ncbi:GNAT family N-acetyltransferase [Tropicimonas sp. IMCC34043]|uniref:GNAT family N-acetyltransferase n=1 Tax=Tropicimonas sp. IMCC34043 TaxID=2248760 RepID=UPI000E2633CC|nr:GNAT family protein [Tropicimonas sp. IMCC34043]
MKDWITPVTLRGSRVVLAPLAPAHGPDLETAVADGALHRLWYTAVPAPGQVAGEIDSRLAQQAAGTMLPFAVLRPDDGAAIGMTTYMNIDAPNRRLEIGSTWYAASVQRSGLNTEAKLLLLGHAFEDLDCIAVEFRTHVMNRQSRAAIERLGARLDGILRAHKILPNGTIRDTAVYSVTASDWPSVRANLLSLLERGGRGG